MKEWTSSGGEVPFVLQTFSEGLLRGAGSVLRRFGGVVAGVRGVRRVRDGWTRGHRAHGPGVVVTRAFKQDKKVQQTKILRVNNRSRLHDSTAHTYPTSPSQHLVPALKHVDVVTDDASLDVLRDSHLSLDGHRQLRQPGNQRRPLRLVPNQRFIRVVDESLLGGNHRDGVVQTGTRESLEILAVGIGAHDHGGVRRVVRDWALTAASERRGAAPAVFAAVKDRALPGSLPTNASPKPTHTLAEHLVGIPSQRVRRVQHERVLRRDHFHEQRRHVQRILLDAAGFAGQKRAFVPLGRPHLLDSLVDIGGRARVAVRSRGGWSRESRGRRAS